MLKFGKVSFFSYICAQKLYIRKEIDMGRVLAIDYGRKRTGLAVTDPMKIIAGPLTTVPTHELEKFLLDYVAKEKVERIVMGLPKRMNGEMSESWQWIEPFLNRLKKILPDMPVDMVDERFTSVLAQRAIIDAGIGKQRRREDKGLIDQTSAVIILQQWMSDAHF